MKKRLNSVKFIVGLLTVVLVLGAIFLGGYFVLDKAVVPKYFSSYGIHSMEDLVGMMRTLYVTPTESEIVVNAYAARDLTSATSKLREKNYPVYEDGNFNFELFEQGQKGNGDISLTDRELAAVIDKLLDSTEFSDILPNLNHIDTINMNLLELSITPKQIDSSTIDKSNAHIKFVLKIDTTEVRSTMAKEMEIPIFLLNMIFPENLYLTANYNVSINNSGETAVWETSEGTLSVNGKDDEQSKVLLDLLFQFIFNKEDQMTIEKFVENFGHILDQGVELFGKIEFANGLGLTKDQNGIYFLPTATTGE